MELHIFTTVFVESKVSQLALLPFWAGQFFIVGAALCIVGCSGSLASAHKMPVAPIQR